MHREKTELVKMEDCEKTVPHSCHASQCLLGVSGAAECWKIVLNLG